MFVSGCFCERQRCEIIIYLYVVGRKIKKTLALFEVRVTFGTFEGTKVHILKWCEVT